MPAGALRPDAVPHARLQAGRPDQAPGQQPMGAGAAAVAVRGVAALAGVVGVVNPPESATSRS